MRLLYGSLRPGVSLGVVFVISVACARTLSFPDAPFAMPDIIEAEVADHAFDLTSFGARPDGTKCTAAFAAAMDACEKAGGGRVVVPKGRWVTGAIRFRNNCELHFEDGAVLEFTDDPADYPAEQTSWEGIECINHSPLLYAYGVTNVAITGRGIIEPRMKLWSEKWAGYDDNQMSATRELYMWGATNATMGSRRLLDLDGAKARPHLIQFNRVKNVLLDGFRINGAPFWLIHLYHSDDCVVRNLSTYARGLNNDGLDIEMTRNVLVEDCRFDQGDDGIVLKAGRNADAWRLNRPTENVVIRNCDLASSHSLLGIGSELSGGIRNVWVTGCKVERVFNLFNVKTGRRRGGFVKNIWVENCVGDDVGTVFNITTVYSAQYAKFPDFEIRYTDICGIHVKNIRCNRARRGVVLHGDAHRPIHDIEIKEINIGEVVKGLSEVTDCRDVRIDGLFLGRPDEERRWTMEDEIDKADSIAAVSPAYAKAVEFLRRPDLCRLGLGRHEIDGNRVFAEIEDVMTEPFSPTDKMAVRDDEHDLIYFIVDGDEEMFEVGAGFSFCWVWRPLVFVVPAGMVHSPHHTNKAPKRIRVCIVKVCADVGSRAQDVCPSDGGF